MSLYGLQNFKIQRLDVPEDIYNSNGEYVETRIFNLEQIKNKETTAKAAGFKLIDQNKYAEFEFHISKMSEADEELLRRLNFTTCKFWPYADNESYNFDVVVTVDIIPVTFRFNAAIMKVRSKSHIIPIFLKTIITHLAITKKPYAPLPFDNDTAHLATTQK